jgi:hypothetical protein
MAAYGSFISAPLNHVLVGLLQRVFVGRTSTRDRVLQILAGNLFVAPIQATGTSLFNDVTLRISLIVGICSLPCFYGCD